MVTADEVVGILAEAKAGGTNPTKVKAVLDLYEKTPTASWANPSIKSKQTVIDTLGTTKLRDFLLLHHSMLPADKRGDDLVDLQTLPLPKPPANVENVLEYTYGANVHFVGYCRKTPTGFMPMCHLRPGVYEMFCIRHSARHT